MSNGDTTLVLGHSLGTDPSTWNQVVPLLAERFDLHQLTLPGHGDAPVPQELFTMDDLADAVAALIRDDVATTKVIFAGVSLSGALGLTLALRHPTLVAGVVTIGASAFLGDASSWHDRATLVRREGTGALLDATRDRWFSTRMREENPNEVARVMQLVDETNNEGYARCAEALASYDLRAQLGEIQLPVCIIGGELDPVAPPASLEHLRRGIPGAHQVIIDGVAHQIAVEAPSRVAQEIGRFADSLQR